MNKIIQGNCLEKLKELEDNSVDSIVTDPPYELGFMGKSWDNTGIANNKEMWAECLRVLKPGGHLLAFSGTRTYHRMACAIEDAGFEVRDMIEWVYGSGFPKSLNIGKAVDKLQGNEREWISESPYKASDEAERASAGKSQSGRTTHPDITKGTSEYEGWGTALKPAHEPICMARKPLSEKTVAENCLKWGVGGINIDGSRVALAGEWDKGTMGTFRKAYDDPDKTYDGTKGNVKFGGDKLRANRDVVEKFGRFPANLIHDNSEEVRECFPETGKAGNVRETDGITAGNSIFGIGDLGKRNPKISGDNGGNASRFFKSIIYQSKASKSERNNGCEGLEAKPSQLNSGGIGRECSVEKRLEENGENAPTMKNNHPTVKPIALMEYLIKMVTPKGGIVLDPFAGSGSTLVAAKQNGYQYIGIEMTEEYIPIIEARLSVAQTVNTLFDVPSNFTF